MNDLGGHLSPMAEINSGLLPPGTRWIGPSRGGRMIILVEIPAGKHELWVKHDHGRYNAKELRVKDVPLPAALAIINMAANATGGYTFGGCSLAALAGARLQSLDDRLYRYPLPNTSPDLGVCWGSTQLHQDYRSIAAIEYVSTMMFRSAFNDHMWDKGALTKEFDWTGIPDCRAVEVYMEKLVQLGEFKNEWLVPASRNLRDLIR